MMKTSTIEERTASSLDMAGGPTISRMFQTETSQRATMLTGSPDEVATKLVEIFKDLGVL
jgi:hypothetical protein